MLELWELAICLITPGLAAVGVARCTKVRSMVCLIIAYLTFVIPVFGANFGASGSEPLWEFGALGLIGGLVWGSPFAIWSLLTKKQS